MYKSLEFKEILGSISLLNKIKERITYQEIREISNEINKIDTFIYIRNTRLSNAFLQDIIGVDFMNEDIVNLSNEDRQKLERCFIRLDIETREVVNQVVRRYYQL